MGEPTHILRHNPALSAHVHSYVPPGRESMVAKPVCTKAGFKAGVPLWEWSSWRLPLAVARSEAAACYCR